MTTRISGINIYTFLPTDPCLAASCLRALEMESEFLQAAHLADVSWSSYCFFHGVNVFFVRSLLTQQLFAERCWRHPLPPFPTNYHPPPAQTFLTVFCPPLHPTSLFCHYYCKAFHSAKPSSVDSASFPGQLFHFSCPF